LVDSLCRGSVTWRRSVYGWEKSTDTIRSASYSPTTHHVLAISYPQIGPPTHILILNERLMELATMLAARHGRPRAGAPCLAARLSSDFPIVYRRPSSRSPAAGQGSRPRPSSCRSRTLSPSVVRRCQALLRCPVRAPPPGSTPKSRSCAVAIPRARPAPESLGCGRRRRSKKCSHPICPPVEDAAALYRAPPPSSPLTSPSCAAALPRAGPALESLRRGCHRRSRTLLTSLLPPVEDVSTVTIFLNLAKPLCRASR
jgi:hypothetical protein